MPADRLSVVLEGGTVEIKVLCFTDLLGVTTDTCIREGLGNRITELTGSR